MSEPRTLLEYLGLHDLFAGLEREQLIAVRQCAEEVRLRPGAYMIRQGGAADRCYIIRSGTASIEMNQDSRTPIQLLGAADVLGWSWLFPPFTWHFDAKATSVVEAVTLDSACLRSLFDRHPRLGLTLTTRFSAMILDRLQATRRRLTARTPGRGTGT